jgi:hypothetical protein
VAEPPSVSLSPGSTHECCGRVQSVRPSQRPAGICAASERNVSPSDTTLRPAGIEHAVPATTLQRRDAQQWCASAVAAPAALSARVSVPGPSRRPDSARRERKRKHAAAGAGADAAGQRTEQRLHALSHPAADPHRAPDIRRTAQEGDQAADEDGLSHVS